MTILSDLRRSALVLREHNQQRRRRRPLPHHELIDEAAAGVGTAADNAVLAMWYTGTHNQEAIELAEAGALRCAR
jgi:hypothetical protein